MNEISGTLYNWLMSFRRVVIVNIMLAAMDEMESYNGQSQTSAIMRAIGAEDVEVDGKPAWKYPKRSKINKEFG